MRRLIPAITIVIVLVSAAFAVPPRLGSRYQKPSIPKYQKPSLQKYKKPSLQKYKKPSAPKYQKPR